MISPLWGPFLFDTSAESLLPRSRDAAVQGWFREYTSYHQLNVSAITVLERIRGYALLSGRSTPAGRTEIESRRLAYLTALGRVWPVDGAVATVAGEIMALLPHPPTPPRRSHQMTESRMERLARWRFDCVIAATALVANLTLIHNNAADFEEIRGAIEKAPQRFPKLGPLGLIRCDALV